jgi:hypothetical protein
MITKFNTSGANPMGNATPNSSGINTTSILALVAVIIIGYVIYNEMKESQKQDSENPQIQPESEIK